MSNQENNTRIAKNAIMLFFRMFLSMGISLYTSRVVLETLGVVDFGIYNVVGGVVVMLSFLNSSMSSATQRFLSFELGRKDLLQLERIFSMTVNIHAIIAIVIFLIAETLGLWFLNTKLNIPVERIEAANWVYQFSILSFMVTVMSVPFNAAIIAHERMGVYAYVSIIEVSLKLLVVFALGWFSYDNLKTYGILLFIAALIIFLIYRAYCRSNFSETRYMLFWDKSLYKTLMNYAGWNLFGNLASVTTDQGVNLLLNMFFGPVVNAARGIAFQVSGAVNGFVRNFQMAMNPQIVKSFAINDINYMHEIIFKGAKYSFFFMLILALPILLETEIILQLWLKKVPPYTLVFTKLVVINVLVDCISGPLMTAAQASGKIRVYQTVVGSTLLLVFPISYFFLEFNYPPRVTLYISIFISLVALFLRLLILRSLIKISFTEFFKEVIVVILYISLIAVFLPLLVRNLMEQSFVRFFVVISLASACSILTVYFFGLGWQEKKFIQKKIIMIQKNIFQN